ncbi:GrpB family protein [Amycolatopsis rubida]|uniref:GrpB family protein n=1 Tax=Amycolatopsis rubida TaxID=112413 RepID=UPI000A7AD4B8|nr:GrpB family protein [Amycolatopsis rubida]
MPAALRHLPPRSSHLNNIRGRTRANASSTLALQRSPDWPLPVIDLAVVIATRDDLPAVVASFQAIGYWHDDVLGISVPG